MNLAQRRAVHEFQTKQFPDLQKEVSKAAGYPLPVEVNWESLAEERDAKLFAGSWPKIYFDPLIAALKEVGRDAMGKEALQEKLRKIVIQNTAGCYFADRWASYEEGVLTLDHESVRNAEDHEDRGKSLVELLESKL